MTTPATGARAKLSAPDNSSAPAEPFQAAEFFERLAERAAEIVLERLEVCNTLHTSQPSEPPASPFVTVAEAAELLRCRPQRIHDLLLRGRLERAGRDGSRVLLDRDAVLAYARSDVAPALPRGAAARMNSWVAA